MAAMVGGGGRGAPMTVDLKRATRHRMFGASMFALLGGIAVGPPVAAIFMVIRFKGHLDGAQWAAVVVFLAMPVLVWRRVGVAYRLAANGPGTVELRPDELVIMDAALFVEPLHVPRADIASVAPRPSGAFAFSAWGDAAKEDATLVSSYAIKPDVLVRFEQRRVLPGVRYSDGLVGPYALRPPHRTKPTSGLWLPTRTSSGADQILAWYGSDPATG